MYKSYLFLLLTFCTSIILAQNSSSIQKQADKIEWKAGPPTLPAGSRVAVLEGDPKVAGMFTMRVELPANSVVKWHTHPADERVTVLEGNVELVFEKESFQFGPGSFYKTPPGVVHSLKVGNKKAVLQMTGIGPWDIDFIKQP